MTFTIDLRAELEATLTRRAAARALSLRDYVCSLLEAGAEAPAQKPALTVEERLTLWRNFDEAPPRTQPLSPAARAKLWRDSVRNLPHFEPLSDEAISR